MSTETIQTEARTLAGPTITAELAVGPDLILTITRHGRPVLDGVVLGLTVDGRALGAGSELVGWETERVEESYVMRTGKAAGHHEVRHEQATATLLDRATGTEWGVVVRVADDGVAFRYRVPAQPGGVEVGDDATRLLLPTGSRAWPLEYQTWYETPRYGADLAELRDGDYGFPFLLRQPDDTYVLVSESAIDGRFSGAHGVVGRDGSGSHTLRVETADPRCVVAGSTTLPWRVLMIGESHDVVASDLVDDLAPAADPALVEAAWIRPGRAAWSWWSDRDSPTSVEAQRRFVDHAAAHGWEHVLVDAGWDARWVPDLVSYARARDVGIFLWSHWEDLSEGESSTETLRRWKSWGVVGVKVDFMESEGRERYRWYDFMIAAAADVELMLNFHGSVIPRGWARTYPHVMSYEGIRGAEYYIMDMPSPTAAHNVIQPFTRNVVGSMDYTPVTFSAADRETSDGHELALSVVFESGISHFADDVAEYQCRPLASAFLDALPSSWSETRLLSGTPDSEAVVARRHGDRWFVGCIATGPARTVELDVAQLVDGPCGVWIVSDDPAGQGLVEQRYSPFAGSSVPVGTALHGGFVAVVGPSSTATTVAR